MKRFFAICLCCFLASFAPAGRSGQDAKWKSDNIHGNRYEGVIVQPNGNSDYTLEDLLAVTGGEPDDNAQALHVAYFLPPREHVAPFHVIERVRETKYLMIPIHLQDVSGKWNVFEGWDTGTVIRPKHVNISNLNFLIRLRDSETPDSIAPAVVYGSVPPKTIRSYVMHLTVLHALRSLSCTVRAGEKPVPCIISPLPHPGLPSSTTVALTVPANDLPEGPVTLQVSGPYADSQHSARLTLDVHFYHQPDLSALLPR